MTTTFDDKALEAHYLQRYGQPALRTEFRRGGRRVEVLKWDPAATGEGIALYATLGASEYPVVGMPPSHRVEYFVGLNPERDEIASPLAGIGLYAVEEQVTVGHGHTVPAGRPLWTGSGMNTMLVLRPINDIILPLQFPDGTHVDFMQVIPIYASELKFKSEHHAEGLLVVWKKTGVPFWDPERAPEPAEATN